jgi:hypothetical protein
VNDGTMTGGRSGNQAPPLHLEGSIAEQWRSRLISHFEFERSGDHNESARTVSILKAHKPKRRVAIDKEATARAALLSNHPISSTVLADHE